MDLILEVVSIILGAVGSIAGAVALLYINRAKAAKDADLQSRKLEYQQRKLEQAEHDALFNEYRLIIESSKNMHAFLKEEIKGLRQDMADLYNDRRNCRKENEELRLRVSQLEDELRLVKRKLADPNSLSLFVPSTQESAL